MQNAIFLDRDGVLIRNRVRDGRPYAITAGESADLIGGVTEACFRLKKDGFLLVMATNQPDVAMGKTPRTFVDETNAWLAATLSLDHVEVCFHADSANCECRKPKPGMLFNAARKLGINLATSFLVGDRWRDIEAGKRGGCATILIDYGYTDVPALEPDYATSSLLNAVDWIESQVQPRTA